MTAPRSKSSPLTPYFTWIGGFLCCLSLAGGCRLCADCELESFPSYGGAWERTVRESGRVGSVFDPGGSRAADLSARADSDDADARNRERLGGSEPQDDDEPDAKSKPKQAPKSDEQLDQDLKEMEDRFKDLDLQDINFREPSSNQADWQ